MFLGILVAFGVSWLLSSQFGVLGLIFSDQGPILAILGASLLIVVIGVADDIWDLDWMTKLAGQFVAAGLVAWLGVQIYSLPIGGLTVGSPVMSIIITLFAIVLVMNAINFIDGLDGLVAGVALIANGTFLVYTYLLQREISPQNYFSLAGVIAAILVGACAGFLPLNWHPAKMFMGDAGALLDRPADGHVGHLGDRARSTRRRCRRSASRRWCPAFIPIILPFAVLVVPLLDFGLAVIRRLRAGKSPFSADRKHLHHRLLDMGHTHLHAVLIFYAWTAVLSIGCLLFFFDPYWMAIVFVAIGLVVCTAFTLAPLSRRKANEAVAELAPAGSREAAETARFDQLDVASETPPTPIRADATARPHRGVPMTDHQDGTRRRRDRRRRRAAAPRRPVLRDVLKYGLILAGGRSPSSGCCSAACSPAGSASPAR